MLFFAVSRLLLWNSRVWGAQLFAVFFLQFFAVSFAVFRFTREPQKGGGKLTFPSGGCKSYYEFPSRPKSEEVVSKGRHLKWYVLHFPPEGHGDCSFFMREPLSEYHYPKGPKIEKKLRFWKFQARVKISSWPPTKALFFVGNSSGAQGPPQFLKKRSSENAWANENLSCGFPSIPGFVPGVAPRIVVFSTAQVVRCHSENGISYSENSFLNSESCSESAPERSQSSKNGLFTPWAFFLKWGWSAGFWIPKVETEHFKLKDWIFQARLIFFTLRALRVSFQDRW